MSNVVIVGASRGIGLALVEAYAKGGDKVFAFCRDPQTAHSLNTLAANCGDAISIMQMDVLDEASVKRAVSDLGDTPVDVLINVAGIFQSETGPEDNDFAHWRESFEAMAIAPFGVALAFLPALEKAKGKVMSVSSQIAASTWPYGGMYSYAASKAALNRAMIGLALDVKGRGVAVGLVHPGYVQTDMGGPNADITPQESAEGIRAVTARLSLDNTGGFWRWNGEVHPW
jgi:NAD(P)-dependent dehydrogenase (short-subunit alcohol dehydrogenase family)